MAVHWGVGDVSRERSRSSMLSATAFFKVVTDLRPRIPQPCLINQTILQLTSKIFTIY